MANPACPYCVTDDATDCCNENGACGACTRDVGHSGPHVVCGDVTHEIELWWPDDNVLHTPTADIVAAMAEVERMRAKEEAVITDFFGWLTAQRLVVASQGSGKPTRPCPHTGKGRDQMRDEGLTRTPRWESRDECKVCGADAYGLDLYGHLPIPGLPEGYYPNNVPVETLIRLYRESRGGGFVPEPPPDERDAEIARLRTALHLLVNMCSDHRPIQMMGVTVFAEDVERVAKDALKVTRG